MAMAMGQRGLTTRVTKLFGIKHPVILPGMSWISEPRLVAAVSEAGGLGIFASGQSVACVCSRGATSAASRAVGVRPLTRR